MPPFKCWKVMFFACLCVTLPVDTEDVCIVERLFSSSLVAIVSLKAPRKLKVCHFKKGTEICNYSYSNTILAVKLNRQVRKSLCNHITKTVSLPRMGTGLHAFGCDTDGDVVVLCCSEADSVSGGITLYTQHPRHESVAHDPRNPSEPIG